MRVLFCLDCVSPAFLLLSVFCVRFVFGLSFLRTICCLLLGLLLFRVLWSCVWFFMAERMLC